ncbi:DUF1150 family protein [Maricaulaceae bacterium MS644]
MAQANEHSNTAEASPLVYVRPVAAAEIIAQVAQSEIEIPQDATLYAVHLEDGTRMAVFSERHAAFAAARSHGANPVSVH